MIDREILKDIGLTNSEITVYLALLHLGSATAGPIITKAELQSSVVHRALSTLIDKGLVSYVLRGKNRSYSVVDPQSLANFLEEKQERLSKIMPMLQASYASTQQNTKVEMFLGKKAIFRMFNDLITIKSPKTKYLSFSLAYEHEDQDVIRFYNIHNPKRKQQGITTLVLANTQVKSIFEKQYSEKILENANIRYSTFHFPQGLVIFNDVVVFHTWQDPASAVKITNKNTACQFRTFFLELYNQTTQ